MNSSKCILCMCMHSYFNSSDWKKNMCKTYITHVKNNCLAINDIFKTRKLFKNQTINTEIDQQLIKKLAYIYIYIY